MDRTFILDATVTERMVFAELLTFEENGIRIRFEVCFILELEYQHFDCVRGFHFEGHGDFVHCCDEQSMLIPSALKWRQCQWTVI